MRFLRGVLIAATLLGCADDSSGPAQPQAGGTESGSEQSNSGGSDAAFAAAADDDRPTRGFYVEGFPNGNSVPIGTDFTEIQRFSSLPRGKYLANASAVLATNDAEVHFVDCVFTTGGALRGELARGMVGGTGTDNFLSLPLTIGFAIGTATDLGVACRTDVPDVVFTQGSPITAIRVDRLTVQP